MGDANDSALPPEPTAELLAWARQSIHDLAVRAREEGVRNIDLANDGDDEGLVAGLDESRHDAIATVGIGFLNHDDPMLRWASVWCLGRIDSYLDETPALVIDRVRLDPNPCVRAAAAWALQNFEDELDIVLPALTVAVDDADAMVQLGAIQSLQQLGRTAINATGALMRVAKDHTHRHRSAAIRALVEVAPDDAAVQELFTASLDREDSAKEFAAYGIGRGKTKPSAAERPLALLLSTDMESTLVAAWALGRMGRPVRDAVPQTLRSMQGETWLAVEDDLINIRPDLLSALSHVLEPIDDETLAHFRMPFFDFAFRKDHTDVLGEADALAQFDFFLKVQRERFGPPRSKTDVQLFDQFMDDAKAMFAQRLRTNPTLGVNPDEFDKLHTKVWWVTRSIASSLWRSLRRARKRAPRAKAQTSFVGFDAIEGEELLKFLFKENCAGLTDSELYVARFRILDGFAIPAVAAMLSLTESQVKTRAKNARTKIERWLRDHA